MAIRLIDKKATKPVNISGTVFHIKQMSGAQKARLSLLMTTNKDGSMSANFDTILSTLSLAIDRIEGFEYRPIEETLSLMADSEDIVKLLSEIMSYSSLSEDERKNSPSSPGLNLQEQKSDTVRRAVTSMIPDGKNSASPITTASIAKDLTSVSQQ